MVNKIKFGEGSITEISDELRERNSSKTLIITDEGVKNSGVVDQVIENFDDDIDYKVWADVVPEPPRENYMNALEEAREYKPGAILGIGGGSAMDVAKTTSIIYEHGGEVLDYLAPPTGGGKEIPGPGLPMIAVPTTAGTGAETSPATVVSLPEKEVKLGISSRHQLPDLAIVDPLLTVSLPAGPTASSGMDALTHAIEAYTTRRFDMKEKPEEASERPDYNGRSILTDLFAKKAIKLISNSLRRAYNNGKDVEARRDMSLAALLAGMAFTNAGLGAVHTMAYPVAGRHHTPHGVTNAVLLPAVMRYNSTGAFSRYKEIAQIMGENVNNDSLDVAADKAATAVNKLSKDVGIPSSLKELGVTKDEIPELASDTLEIKRLLIGNPRRVDQEALEEIFKDAL